MGWSVVVVVVVVVWAIYEMACSSGGMGYLPYEQYCYGVGYLCYGLW